MASLTRKTQIAMAIEDQMGVAETLVAGDLLPVLADPAPTFEPDFPMIRRNLARESLTPDQGVPSFRSGRIRFTMELAGPADGNPATEPDFSIPLQACGMIREAIKVVRGDSSHATPGSIIPFNATYSQATTSAVGRTRGRWFDGDSRFFAFPDTGSPALSGATNVITADGAAALQTGLAYADGQCWRPTSRHLHAISVSAVGSGPIAVNDVIYQAATGARGRVVEAINAAGTLKYELYDLSGVFTTGTDITVVGGAATATPNGTQTQYETPSVTVAARVDGSVLTLRAARGTVSIRFEAGGRVLMDFEFLGIGTQPADGVLLSPEPTAPALPAVLTGSTLDIGIAAATGSRVVPCWQAGVFALNNNLALITCPDDVSGYDGTAITSREPGGNLNPQLIREAVFPILGNAWTKASFRMRLVVGTEANNGNSFSIQAPFAQLDSFSLGDRNGIRTVEKTLTFARANANQTGTTGTAGEEELQILMY